MERLHGNIWFHDPGTGEVSFYQRLGRNMRPLRAETGEFPEGLSFEAKQAVEVKLAQMRGILNEQTPKAVRLAQLEKALELFPAYTSLSASEKEAFIESLTPGIPETWTPPVQEIRGLPRAPTVEEQVEAANTKRQEEISELAKTQTENLRLQEELARLKANHGEEE